MRGLLLWVRDADVRKFVRDVYRLSDARAREDLLEEIVHDSKRCSRVEYELRGGVQANTEGCYAVRSFPAKALPPAG